MTEFIQCPDVAEALQKRKGFTHDTFLAYRSVNDRFGIALANLPIVYPWVRDDTYREGVRTYRWSWGIQADIAMGFIIRDLLSVLSLIDESRAFEERHTGIERIKRHVIDTFKVIIRLYYTEKISGRITIDHKGLIRRHRLCPRDIREAYRRPDGRVDIHYALSRLKDLTGVANVYEMEAVEAPV